MLPSNGKPEIKEHDYYITPEELSILVKEMRSKKTKKDHWELATWFLILTGRRISEVLATQIQDFPLYKNFNFSKWTVRLAKTNKVITLPIVEPLQDLIKQYVIKHQDKLVGGYLFPNTTTSYFDKPYRTPEQYGAWFSKLRRRCGERHPGFKEKYPDGVYRIHPHTLRHFFQTLAWDKTRSLLFIKELMGYRDAKTVQIYVSKAEMRGKIPEYMERHITPLAHMLTGLQPGQKSLAEY